MEDFFGALRVREPYIDKPYLMIESGDCILDKLQQWLRLLIDETENPTGRGESVLNRIIDLSERLERLKHHEEECQEADEILSTEAFPGKHFPAAEPQ